MYDYSDVKVVIPIKAISTRCPEKNFKPFYQEMSLTEIKIKQALQVVSAEQITLFVGYYSDGELEKKRDWLFNLCSPLKINIEFRKLKPNKDIIFFNIFHQIKKKFNPELTIFYFVTMPFLDGLELKNAINEIRDSSRKLLLSAYHIESQVFDINGVPQNFSKFRLRGGQMLKQYQVVKAGIMIIKNSFSTFSLKPLFYNPPLLKSVDINSVSDWNIAQQYLQLPEIRKVLD